MLEKPLEKSDSPNTEVISKLHVGLVRWQLDDEIGTYVSDTLKRIGCKVSEFSFDAALPKGLDVVIARGPMGSLTPVINQLRAYPGRQRPAFVLLMTEQLPDPSLPEWVRRGLGLLRSRVERLAFRPNGAGWQVRPWLGQLTKKGHRFRYYGDLFWLKQEGLLSVLAIGSYWTAARLRAQGFDPFVPPFSYRPEWGADLSLKRDIPVLWLGKIATKRRRRLLSRLRTELAARHIELLMIDGEENPYVFGEARTVLLNRTKIVLNLLREKWDDNSLRFTLATYNKALIVTEPTLPHTDFVPGVHLVEAPIEQMADTICYYLEHEEERRRIVTQAHRLLTEGASREGPMIEILERAITVRRSWVQAEEPSNYSLASPVAIKEDRP